MPLDKVYKATSYDCKGVTLGAFTMKLERRVPRKHERTTRVPSYRGWIKLYKKKKKKKKKNPLHLWSLARFKVIIDCFEGILWTMQIKALPH